MPRYNTTIEDVSPLITYDSAWAAGNSSIDSSILRYSDSSLTIAETVGATATFRFNGTGVWIFGAKRNNHGPYNVILDGQTFAGDGFSQEGEFRTPLFSAANLTLGMHELKIVNAPTRRRRRFLDVDFITWESEVGTSTEPLSQTKLEDSSSLFTYSPADAWDSNVARFGGAFTGGSGHLTTVSNAAMSLNFSGDAVTLFGPLGGGSSDYDVQLDGGAPVRFTKGPIRQTTSQQTVIYHASSLGPGNHTIRVTKQSGSGPPLGIDFATISSAPSLSILPSTQYSALARPTLSKDTASVQPTSSQAAVQATKPEFNAAGIVGIILGILSVLAVTVGLCIVLGRRRNRERSATKHPSQPSQPPIPEKTLEAGLSLSALEAGLSQSAQWQHPAAKEWEAGSPVSLYWQQSPTSMGPKSSYSISSTATAATVRAPLFPLKRKPVPSIEPLERDLSDASSITTIESSSFDYFVDSIPPACAVTIPHARPESPTLAMSIRTLARSGSMYSYTAPQSRSPDPPVPSLPPGIRERMELEVTSPVSATVGGKIYVSRWYQDGGPFHDPKNPPPDYHTWL